MRASIRLHRDATGDFCWHIRIYERFFRNVSAGHRGSALAALEDACTRGEARTDSGLPFLP